MTEQEVVALMKSSTSSAEWNRNCDEVKRKCDGYPAFWFAAIVASGVMRRTLASFGGDADVHVVAVPKNDAQEKQTPSGFGETRMTYEQLQAEQAAWAAERFGGERSATEALKPFAGVVEELGELDEANLRGDRDGIEDAIGDAVIYLCDVCTRMGWTMPGIRSLAIPCNSELSYLGRLAHSVLKTAQGIRRDEDHDAVGNEAVYWLLDDLDNVAAHWQLGSALKCATATWKNVVSKRNAGHDAIPEVTP